MKPDRPLSSEDIDAALIRLKQRYAAGNEPMARWMTETMAKLETRLAKDVTDPRELAEARAAALAFIRMTLEQWAKRAPHE